MRLDLCGEQVALDAGHDVLEVKDGYEAGAVLVIAPEGLNGILLMEVVQELTELRVADDALLRFAEVQFDEGRVHVERNALVELRLTHYLHKFT